MKKTRLLVNNWFNLSEKTKIELVTITLEWVQGFPEYVLLVGATHGLGVDIENDDVIVRLNDYNDFSGYAKQYDREELEYKNELAEMRQDYISERMP